MTIHVPPAELEVFTQKIYLPVPDLDYATRQQSYARLEVVAASHPDQVCGRARRIGYTDTGPDALAMYRLKIRLGSRVHPPRDVITLPGYFVVERHHFTPLLGALS